MRCARACWLPPATTTWRCSSESAPGRHRRATHVPRTATLIREDHGWVVACSDFRCRLTDTKGLRYVAELVRSPGVERHALDLVDRVEGVAAGDFPVDRRQLGDAGEVVDGKARTAYRHRIEALRSDIDDALDADAPDRAEVLQAELDQLVAHLARADWEVVVVERRRRRSGPV